MTHDDLIGSSEAARILGTSNRTVHRLVRDGHLKRVMTTPGGKHGAYLYHRDDVEEIAAARAEAQAVA